MKIVLITGASKGIGLATAKKFLENGWKVIGTYLNTPATIEHPNLVTFKYDQSSRESIDNLVEQVKQITTHLDALINNAGILIDPEDNFADSVKVRKTLEVNVVGLIDLTEKLIPLLDRDSHIVNLSSGHSVISKPVFEGAPASGYRISKAALNMYTRHLAFRLEPKGIIVSAIAPGWVKTDMGNSIVTDARRPDREPEDAANDIYNLVNSVKETGHFWRYGQKTDW